MSSPGRVGGKMFWIYLSSFLECSLGDQFQLNTRNYPCNKQLVCNFVSFSLYFPCCQSPTQGIHQLAFYQERGQSDRWMILKWSCQPFTESFHLLDQSWIFDSLDFWPSDSRVISLKGSFLDPWFIRLLARILFKQTWVLPCILLSSLLRWDHALYEGRSPHPTPPPKFRNISWGLDSKVVPANMFFA